MIELLSKAFRTHHLISMTDCIYIYVYVLDMHIIYIYVLEVNIFDTYIYVLEYKRNKLDS